MQVLLNHLNSDKYWEAFEPLEFTTATRFLYTAIGSAAYDNADKLIIKPNGFEWYKAEVLVGTHLGQPGDPVPVPSYNVVLHTILQRDILTRNHLTIVTESPDQTVVELKP